ncbi:hypothetical protein COT75_00085 [Candidatus Beckwithbacteria bacterium CG10_big_fil_rev_8_21_14_0_10_34_10]|uniref:Cupin type-2 domain-containing protein n=1 Tax=Candidatus Beckwithbacteria bacterium CG10_big_fil_rev_8_21_14_0_10_34_10 TaxID=1974495 RepID=A0A2H0WAB3_9BACT|nr:MAG: hypothetical protein COT75_00085 [Candidatus Beckwithbacteria bacterium CG10_big_fil_rev_8_21_14_0_10_34_10]
MKKETSQQCSERIIKQLKTKYPKAKAFDLDGREKHFVCEVEPTKDHPEYDRAVEVIISSKPHKHLRMTQDYTILSGTLKLYLENKTIMLKAGDKYRVPPKKVHWAESNDECWLEIYSKPGWTAKDHIPVK